MSDASEIDALLERLVAQFASPYDFLRELVQNAMDAGSDRVEVSLETHPVEGGDADEVVFELGVVDTGAGMNEAIVDQELTRLFASGKKGDRTTAGGYGIGFVSVFAWEPDAVLLQTGRTGEAWELVFDRSRAFEKAPVDAPVEGTTVILFRRGRAGEREAVADAIRDSLWRWCRYCPLEITFEDFDDGHGPELIQDSPEPPEDALTLVDDGGDTTLRVSFGVPAHVVLLRRGLILAEGYPRQELPDLVQPLGRGVEHLQVWADSPLLRTTMARDKVVDDGGRTEVGKRVLAMVDRLRGKLFAAVEGLAGTQAAWDSHTHARYAVLMGHLLLESQTSSGGWLEELSRRQLVRRAGVPGAYTLRQLQHVLGGRPLLVSRGDFGGDERARSLLAAVAATELPVVVGDEIEDRPWLESLAEAAQLPLRPLEDAVSRVDPVQGEATALVALLQGLLKGVGLRDVGVQLGRFADVIDIDPPLVGTSVGTAEVPLALYGGPSLPPGVVHGRTLWLNREHVLCQAAMRSFGTAPLVAATTLAAAVLGRMGADAPAPAELVAVAEELRP